MSKLLVDAPGLPETVRVELPDGGAVLVGREPDPAALSEADRGDAPFTTLSLASPSVSANHVVIARRGATVSVRDLESRNGTWLRVPPRQPIDAVVEGDLRLQLAAAPSAARAEPEPDDPSYAGPRDLGLAVANSVEKWLSRKGIRARARVMRQGSARRGDEVARFLLATGEALCIGSEQTLDASAERAIEGLRPWVARQNTAFLAEEETRGEGMVLASAEIREAHRVMVESARRGITSVVILGPSGSGKERLARTFHRNTGRGGPFIALNCSTLDRGFARADLFGAEVGAYTGCVRARLGAIERAHGGTLFLDEIGEMPQDVQAFLLRFLDEGGEFERMGGERVRHADVRIVCATNRDLRDAAQRGAFRQDLWWRVSVQVVEVPALRRRFDDVLAFLRARGVGDVPLLDALTPEALEVLRAHPWPGNFRELMNLVARLPQRAAPGSLDAPAVRHALGTGALAAPEEPPAQGAAPDIEGARWEDIARLAALAFAEDHGRAAPDQWGDVATFVEQYLKPIALQRMAEAAGGDGEVPPIRELSQRTQADTKTVMKHLRRYAERFGR